MIYVAIAIHSFLAFLNYSLARSIFYPNFLFTAVWGISLVVLAMLGDFFYELSELSLVIFSFGALFFSVGGIVGKMLFRSISSKTRENEKGSNKNYSRLLNIAIIAILIIFPFYITKIMELSALSGLDEFWKGLRFQTSSGATDEAGLGVFSYFGAFANFLALIAYNESLNNRYSKKAAAFLILLVFVYGIISTARTGVLTLLLAMISVLSINKRISFASVLTSICLFLLIFILPAIFLDKGGSVDNSFSENLTSLLENLQIYALAGIVAFSEVTKNIAMAPENNGVFAFFLSFMRAIGMDVVTKSSVLSYISTPWPTNVYTIYLQYYVQFGIVGVLVIMTLIGTAVSIFYELAIRKVPEFVVLNALGTAFVMISVFSESFFTALSYWLQLFIFLFLFYRVMPFIRFGRREARAS